MSRKINCCSMMTRSEVVDFGGDVRTWLVENVPDSADTLLAFSLDGLIWGKLENGQLTVAHDVENQCSAELDLDILQEARLFGKTAELHLWLCDGAWHCRLTQDNDAEQGRHYIEEQQILWGDQPEQIDNSGFTLMSDGVQGLHHAVPIPVSKPTKAQARESNPNQYRERPLRLTVRHYLAEEPFARIEFSRLVSLSVASKDGNQNGKQE